MAFSVRAYHERIGFSVIFSIENISKYTESTIIALSAFNAQR